ncbi:MAG: sensor histidine kinase, partial [Lacticaseibacillus rhamnosus]|nr:sensor histidine kinase [Lacticaseibacillus rhamnosus]
MLLMLTIVLAAFLVISLAYIISLKTNLKRAGQEIWRLSEQEFSMPLLQQTNVKELQQLYASINHLLKLNRD